MSEPVIDKNAPYKTHLEYVNRLHAKAEQTKIQLEALLVKINNQTIGVLREAKQLLASSKQPRVRDVPS